MIKSASRMLTTLAALGIGLAAMAVVPAVFQRAWVYANPGPDLIVESITVNPSGPAVGQQVTISVQLKNVGDAPASGTFTNCLYIDPLVQPPVLGTFCNGGQWGLSNLQPPPYVPTVYNRTHVFATAGCTHTLYARADVGEKVVENNEVNNVVSTTVCVGVSGAPDAFEPDNTCGAERWITNTQGLYPQARTLWPAGDEDLVKFTALAGVSYTIRAGNLQAHADPRIELSASCNGFKLAQGGPELNWLAPATGVYHLDIYNSQAISSPLTGYSLTVTADSSGLYDPYEPDDTCNAARDITTDGTPQTHYFQVMSDTDWVKFPIAGGDTYVVVADNPGAPGVSPNVSVYGTCAATFGAPMAQGAAPEVAAAVPGMLYARVANNGATYGISASYDLRVDTVACIPDVREPDNTPLQAKTVNPGDPPVTHNTCPAGDRDWVKFTAAAGEAYVLETSNLGPAADTEILLYASDGTTVTEELARNDDYTSGLLNSRIVWPIETAGTYMAMVHHVKPQAAGANTRYDLAIYAGACRVDGYENGDQDNGPLSAPAIQIGGAFAQAHNLCPAGDQDWVQFQSIPGHPYTIQTSNLSAGGDTVLHLYGPGGALLASNDDIGPGGGSSITYTLPSAGTYYVQAISFDTNSFGSATAYSLSVQADLPPTPTPTPTPTKTPTPTPQATPQPSASHTLILVNRQRFEDLYSADASWQIMAKLYQYAERPEVAGLVAQVEQDPSVANAYAVWTLNETTLLSTTLANNVTAAVRNLVLTLMPSMTSPRRLVIVGDDRLIPFRRVIDYTSKKEDQYAASVTISTTQWAALRDAMTLTDDYYADLAPSTWSQGEIYLPDFGVGRLVETPQEIMGAIDAYVALDHGSTVRRALVSGYSFASDSATTINTLAGADSLTRTTLIGDSWVASTLASNQLQASPRLDIQSINGHSTHTEEKAPDESAVAASEIAAASVDLSGAVIYTVGCHAGLNDPGELDLVQAFVQKGASYVANTGYGWGGGGITCSEALMRNLTKSLLGGVSTELGDALRRAKATYYFTGTSQNPDAYDHKVLAEATLYGLPTWVITTGATFADQDPFPGVVFTPTVPGGYQAAMAASASAMAAARAGNGLVTGTISFGLAGAFGDAFEPGTVTETQGYFGEGAFYTLNGNVSAAAGEPVQPQLFANLTAPSAGTLRSVVFLSGIYTDIQGFDPIIVQPFNEYVIPTAEPAFSQPGWFPPVPFGVSNSAGSFAGADMLVTTMGQFNSAANVERLYTNMSFGSSYSSDPDVAPPVIEYVGAVLQGSTGQAYVKVQASDDTGVGRVVVAYTHGDGVWRSVDLAFSPVLAKWTGEFPATSGTLFFVQALDVAGNMETAHNKGAYYAVQPPAPLVPGEGFRRNYLPVVVRGN